MMAKFTHYILPLLLVSSYGHAEQIDKAGFEQANSKVSQANLLKVLPSPSDYESTISSFESSEQQIIARSQIIRALSNGKLTEQQKNWLVKQQNSDLVLTTADADHPQKTIQLVNIKHMANTAIGTWQSNNLAKHFSEKILASDWQWQTLAKQVSREAANAFEVAFSKLTDDEKRNLITDYLSVHDEHDINNQHLFSMFESTKDTRLLSLLWASIDSYSYQVLQQLPASKLEENNVIRYIEQAASYPELNSQALYLLAKHYPSNLQTHNILLQYLKHPEHQWSAALVASKIKDPKFHLSLNELAASDPNRAIAYTLKQASALQE